MEQGYAGCFKGVGGVFFFSSGVVSGIVQYTIFCFVLLDDHCIIIILQVMCIDHPRPSVVHVDRCSPPSASKSLCKN